MTDKTAAALALVATLVDRKQVEALRENAIRRGATLVIEAANARLATLAKPDKAISNFVNKDASYRKAHHVGDYFIEYVDVRGRDWIVNISRNGAFETVAPVVWKHDRKDSGGTLTQRVNFTTPERAEAFAAKTSFLVASRLKNEDAVGKETVFEAVLEVAPISQAEPTQRRRGPATKGWIRPKVIPLWPDSAPPFSELAAYVIDITGQASRWRYELAKIGERRTAGRANPDCCRRPML